MVRVRRPRMSASEKAELWKRWKRGESLSDIGRALGRIPGAVHHVVSARGGVPPPFRIRARRSLTLAEREEISRGLARNCSLRQIETLLHEDSGRVGLLGPVFSDPSTGATLRGCSRRCIPRTRRSTAWRTGRPITGPSFDAAMSRCGWHRKRSPPGHLARLAGGVGSGGTRISPSRPP